MTVERRAAFLGTLLALAPLRASAEPQPTNVSTRTFVVSVTPDAFSAFSADRMVALPDGTRFVLGSGASNSANANFLLKVNPDGTQAWAVSVADPFSANVTGLAADTTGNAYVAYTDFSNFSEPHARVVKFNAAGGQVASADLTTDTPGGDGFPFSEGVGVDSARGRVYAAYSFFSNAQSQDTFAVAALDTDLQPVATRIYDPGFTGSIGVFPDGGTLVDGNGDVWVVALQVPPASDAQLLAARFTPDLAAEASPAPLTSPSVEEVGGTADPRGGIVAAGDRQADGNLYLHRVTAGGFGGPFRFEGFDFVPSPMAVDPAGSLYILGFDPSTFFPAVAKVNASNALAWDQPGPYLNLPETFSPGAVAAASSATFAVASVDFNADPIPVVLLHYQAAASSAADTTPPSAITDLAVTQVFQSSVTLTWTAPGDDASTGTATRYDLRHSTLGPILSEAAFAASTQAVNLSTPSVAGSTESVVLIGLNPATTYFFAIKAVDEAGNAGTLSNSPSGRTVSASRGRLSISAGNDQIGIVGSTLPIPMTAIVKDSSGTALAGIGVDFSISSAPAGATGQGFSSSDTVTGADGKASAVFQLGSVPADYEVRCACPTCETDASTVTFRACGKLANDDFDQFDVRWGTSTYDNTNVAIAAEGCALSSLATLNNFYRTTVSTAIPQTDPAALNQSLRNLNGYAVGGRIDWTRISQASNGGVRFVSTRNIGPNTSRQQLEADVDRDLLAGRPVVIRVLRTRANGTQGEHFVLAVGRCGGEYVISDPGSATRSSFNPADPNFTLTGIRRFAP
jgi:hypothetical protein